MANALSREKSLTTPLDYHAVASSQDRDAELQDVLKNGSALRLERVHMPGTDVTIYCDTSTPQPRPYITTTFIRQAFDALYGLSHPGANATAMLVSQRFVWPGVGKDCRAWKRACTPCKLSKVTRHVKAPSGVSTSRRRVSLISISTWSLHSLSLRVSGIVSPPSTDTHVGLRHSLCLTLPPKQSLRPSYLSGLLVSAALSKSQPTRAGNSRTAFSRLAAITGSSLTRTTAWHPASNGMIKGHTVSWRPPTCAMPMNTGSKPFRWSCWGFAVLGMRTYKSHQSNLCTALPCGYSGILRPFPLRMHRRHRLRVPIEGPHWKASPHTSYSSCSAIHVHFQGTGHRLACLSTARCTPGSPPSPVYRSI